MNNYYKVKKEDLIGKLEGFPIEVVQRMIKEQVAQGNEADISVFQNFHFSDVEHGGFDWEDTSNGIEFYKDVIINRNFDRFFKSIRGTDEEVSTYTNNDLTFVNLYYNPSTRKYKTGRKIYESYDEAVENINNEMKDYFYFNTIENAINEK